MKAACIIVQPSLAAFKTCKSSRLKLPVLSYHFPSPASFSSSSSSSFSSSSSKQSISSILSKRLSSSIANQHHLPRFIVPSSKVELIEQPSHFYNELLAIISRAKRRIFIASLYIGKTEVELISKLREALSRRQKLQVTILVDSLRSTREGEYLGTSKSSSCASLLAKLQSDYPERVHVRLYRAPGLPGWLEKLVGKRFVEGWGLQHMKIYGGDDEVMTSGANLSNDYFTNRRDRYILLKDAAISQYMYTLLMTAARYSHSVKSISKLAHVDGKERDEHHSSYELSWDEGRNLPMKVDNKRTHGPKTWKTGMKQEVEAMTEIWHKSQKSALSLAKQDSNSDYIQLVPLLQMGPLSVNHETTCVPLVLQAADSPNARIDFTTGYFSINPAYAEVILNGRFESEMITASPQANGFYGSKGISGHLPAAYTWLESLFWGRLKEKDRLNKVTVREWFKKDWTYHAKGIWLYPEGSSQSAPTMTLLGSSNFGTRSAHLDLECTLLIDASQSPTMQQRLREEVKELQMDASDVVNEEMFLRPERKVHWGVKLATRFIKRML